MSVKCDSASLRCVMLLLTRFILISWEIVEDDSAFGVYVPDRFKDDMFTLFSEHDWTPFEIATVYSITELRVLAILKLKANERDVLPGLVADQPEVVSMFGLGSKMKISEDSEEDDAVERDEEEAEAQANTKKQARGVRLPIYTGDEIETEMTELFYENPFVFKHVPISFHKATDPKWSEDYDGADLSMDDDDYPLPEDNNIITLHDGEQLEDVVREMNVDRARPQTGTSVLEGRSRGKVSS